MDDWRRCPTCDVYDRISSHKCEPAFEVHGEEDFHWDDERDEPVYEWTRIHARDEEAAAGKLAEKSDERLRDSWDWPKNLEDFRDVWVRPLGAEGDGTLYRVEMEIRPHYSARLKPESTAAGTPAGSIQEKTQCRS